MTEQTAPQPSAPHPPRSGSGRHEQRTPPPRPSFDPRHIRFTPPLDLELFNSIADTAARAVAANRAMNRPSQLRRFYDELMLWESKVARQPDKFNEYLPFIRMINAKVAYAHGRRLVDTTFLNLMQHTLGQVTDKPDTLTTCKLFWEAFLGFYKRHRPND